MDTTPQTVWTPKGGEGEYSSTGNPNLDTEAGLDLLTESGNNLIEEDSSLTAVSPTAWVSNDGS